MADILTPINPATTNSAFAPFIKREADGYQLLLNVEGIKCAKCIWSIESNLKKEDAVTDARVNMSTSRLSLKWQGNEAKADALIAIVEKLGFKVAPMRAIAKKEHSEVAMLQKAMAVAGFAMGNIMLISVALWSSEHEVMGVATRDLLHWLSALIALPTIAYSGRPFFTSALSALKAGHANMDVPISLALILAACMSIFETMQSGEHAYFDSAVMLLFFLLIGRWLDAKARGKAREHATELLALLEGTATLIKDGKQRIVAISDLQAGDVVRIAAGEKVPTDAKVLEGESEIDTSLVTGESLPKACHIGDVVYGGTMNLNAPLTCKILQASEESLLAEVIRLMEKAEQGRARYTRLADRAAQLYTPVVHTLSLLAFLGWMFIGDLAWQDALLIAITTLIITCPCALGLAVPVVQVLAVESLMKRGILVKTGDALERLSAIDAVIFDKTGTLTEGKPEVIAYEGSKEWLGAIASLADQSNHPLSKAISCYINAERIGLKDVKEIAGQGIEAVYKEKKIFLGRHKNKHEAELTHAIFSVENQPQGHFTFKDALRDNTKETIMELNSNQLSTHLISGDHPKIVDAIADNLDVSESKANMFPDEKINYIKNLQAKGKRCFMVGDGLNDAPALMQADVSMSPSTGMDITQNAADFVFQGNSLRSVLLSWKVACFSTKLVKQNFALAVLYNLIAIPLAVMGYVTPLIAAIAMSSSSLLVVGNAFRIRFMKD